MRSSFIYKKSWGHLPFTEKFWSYPFSAPAAVESWFETFTGWVAQAMWWTGGLQRLCGGLFKSDNKGTISKQSWSWGLAELGIRKNNNKNSAWYLDNYCPSHLPDVLTTLVNVEVIDRRLKGRFHRLYCRATNLYVL